MIDYPSALRLILDQCVPLASKPADLDALARTSPVKAVQSQMNVPSFNNSAMDGFALRAAETQHASPESPVELLVSGLVAAGQMPAETQAGQALEIMTGAPVPASCDAVIPIERVTVNKRGESSFIQINEPAKTGQNIRLAGEDFTAEQTIFRQGKTIEPHHLMGLAATGIDQLEVRSAPRVALITTGSELADVGVTEGTSQIRNSNGPYLRACCEQLGIEITHQASTNDDAQALRAAIESASKQADIVITTGGVSAGRYDLVPGAVTSAGGEVIFHKVAIRPGKPLLFARLANGSLFFGLPGNPIAVAVGWRFFVVPALRSLLGLEPERTITSVCAAPIKAKRNLTFFGKARATVNAEGVLMTTLLPGQESFRIYPLMQANCWAIVPGGAETLDTGERIEIAPLYTHGLQL